MSDAVSVCIRCYQHEKLIEECIRSVLSQKGVNLKEIIIGDDASTDGSWQVISGIARLDGRIKARRRESSSKLYVDGRPTGIRNLISCLGEAEGEFIALCDGDDYWTDEWKLKKQIDLMKERNVGLSGHRAAVVIGQDGVRGKIVGRSDRGSARQFSLREMVRFDGNIAPFSSIVLSRRSNARVLDVLRTEQVRGHTMVLVLGASVSGACVSHEIMSAYRVNVSGSATDRWFGNNSAKRDIARQRFRWVTYCLLHTDLDRAAMFRLSARRLADVLHVCGPVEQFSVLFGRNNSCNTLPPNEKVKLLIFSSVYVFKKLLIFPIKSLKSYWLAK